MKQRFVVACTMVLLTAPVLAEDPAHARGHAVPAGVVEPILAVPADAVEAVATVDRFFEALASGRISAAAAELDPGVLILEGGRAERSASEYLGGHAKGDAEFLKGARHRLHHRTAGIDGNLAWVASESELQVQLNGAPRTILSNETMLLQRSATGWKIVHIHWSSREKK